MSVGVPRKLDSSELWFFVRLAELRGTAGQNIYTTDSIMLVTVRHLRWWFHFQLMQFNGCLTMNYSRIMPNGS